VSGGGGGVCLEKLNGEREGGGVMRVMRN